MNSKFIILASILIICAFIVEETSAQYYAGAAYSNYYPSSYYGSAYGAYNGYAGSYYGYGYPSAYSYYGKRSAGFGPNQPTQQ
ncbi:unnamed protein product [Caenorhabditis angaria]|uniref:Uncharacterized protein n=1 Tax=Caenorhabditis angaria TaxID=860376 RepID=A0A9P1IVN0_9PELO|nr:unnamed protein product [Caenorhabditis angaria]